MNLNRKWAFACVLALGTAAGVVAVGCGDDSTTPATSSDAGKNTTDGKASSTVDGTPGGGEDGTAPVDAGSVYDHLGQRAGIRTAVGHVVEDMMGGELADPSIASYFFIRTPGVSSFPSASSPDPGTIEECFTDLVANAAGGPESYPTMEDGGFMCRDMGTAHNGLHISNDAFGTFIAIAVAKLTALGVASADLQALGPKLLALQGMIADSTRDSGVPDGSAYAARCQDIPDGGDGGEKVCDPF